MKVIKRECEQEIHFPMLKICLLFILTLTLKLCSAQLTDISPYSRYGIGNLQNQYSVMNFSMGGTGVATHNDSIFPYFMNLENPASYAYNYIPSFDSMQSIGIKMVCFEAGILDNAQFQTVEGQTATSNNAGLGYVTMDFAVSKHFGGAFGLTPYSNEGYNILLNGYVNDNNFPNSATPLEQQFEGSGGVNRLFAGVGYSTPIFNQNQNLAVGFDVSYLFGNLSNEEDIIFPNSTTILSTQKVETYAVHGFTLDYGIMYTQKLFKTWAITLGATTSLTANINDDYSILEDGNFNVQGGTNTIIDTVQDSSRLGKITIPLQERFGITIKKGEKWTFSADYAIQYWSQFTALSEGENLGNSATMGFGIQYVPTKSSDRSINYFKKIYYRIGFSSSTNYLDLNGIQLNQQYVSFGFGFPIGIRRNFQPMNASILNIGFQLGQLGTTNNNLIRQDYFQIMFGFTFNDQWFIKPKFE